MDAPRPASVGAVSGDSNPDPPATDPAPGLGGLTPELWQLVYGSASSASSSNGAAVALRDVLRGRAVCRGFRAALPKALRSTVLDRPLSQADLLWVCRTFPHLQQLELRSRPTAAAAATTTATARDRAGGGRGAEKEEEDDEEEEEEAAGGVRDWSHWGDWSGRRRRRQAARKQQQALDLSPAAGVWLPHLEELTVTFTPLRTCVFTSANTPRLQRLAVIQLQDSGPLDAFHLQLPELTRASLDGVAVRDGSGFGAALSACPRLRAFTAGRLLGVHGSHHLALPACQQLCLRRCEDLRGLRLWAPRLQLLDLTGCMSLSRLELVADEEALGDSGAVPSGAGGPEVLLAPEQVGAAGSAAAHASKEQLLSPGLSRTGIALAPAGPAAADGTASVVGASGSCSAAAPPAPDTSAAPLVVDLSGTLASSTTLQHLKSHPRVQKLLLLPEGACSSSGSSSSGGGGGRGGGGGAVGLEGASGGGPPGSGGGSEELGRGAGAGPVVSGGEGSGSAVDAAHEEAGPAATAAVSHLAAALAGASLHY